VVTAEEARPDTAGRQTQVAALCWLTRASGAGDGARRPPPTLHPWVRRTLVRKLAVRGRSEACWSRVYESLQQCCAGTLTDLRYYEMSVRRFSDAIADLNTRFDRLDAESWIAELNMITSAPHQHASQPDAVSQHGGLMEALLTGAPTPEELPSRDPHGERWMTIAGMTIARWIWSDPLRDPTLLMSPLGQLRLVAEAQFYGHGGRP
jgi:hypothetical protein